MVATSSNDPTQSLPLELSLATSLPHLSLNRIITSRLPLCLPSDAPDPLLYTAGMTVFSQIYIGMEDAWLQVLGSTTTDERILRMLRTVRIEELARSARLRTDLDELKTRFRDKQLSRLREIEAVTRHYALDLHDLLTQKPYLLLAWSWNMYLAIFNGGRYIRQQLRSADAEFWLGEPALTFWEFEGDSDGEYVKENFKSKFEQASQMVTKEERAEVVEEAKRVMAICGEMVEVLDRSFDVPERTEEYSSRSSNLTTKHNSNSLYLTILTVLAGIWHALMRLCTSWRGVVGSTIETKEAHIE